MSPWEISDRASALISKLLGEKIELKGSIKKGPYQRLVAASYVLAPDKDERTIPLYRELAAKITKQHKQLSSRYDFKPTDEDPYASYKDMKGSVDQQRQAGNKRPELKVYAKEPKGEHGHPAISNDENVCFAAGTLVRTYEGFKPIQDIVTGDLVLSADGDFNRVLGVMSRHYDGKVFEIETNASAHAITVTPEHPFYMLIGLHAESRKTPCTPYVCARSYRRVSLDADKNHRFSWVEAKHIRKGMWFPLAVDSASVEIQSVKVPEIFWGQLRRCHKCVNNRKTRLTCTHRRLPVAKGPLEFELTDDFLWMVGFYVAEGCSPASPTANKISFAMHAKEEIFLSRLIEIVTKYGYGFASRPTGDNGWSLDVHTAILHKWFKAWLGKDAGSKRIPVELLRLPPSKLRHVVQGIFDGDGRKARGDVSQTSSILALQLVEAGHRLGFQPTTSKEERTNPKHATAYDVHELLEAKHELKQKKYTWRILGRNCRKINSITSRDFSGKVYNLHVDGDHTYTVENVPVHNCLRGVHDAIAHLAGGHTFSTRGEYGAYNRHLKTLPRSVAPILFTEIVGQIAFHACYGNKYADQKAAFLPDFDPFNLGRLSSDSKLNRWFVFHDKVLQPRNGFDSTEFSRAFPDLTKALTDQPGFDVQSWDTYSSGTDPSTTRKAAR